MDCCFNIDAIAMVILNQLDRSSAPRLTATCKGFFQNNLWQEAIIERELNGARVPKGKARLVTLRYFKLSDTSDWAQAQAVFHRVYVHCMHGLVDTAIGFDSLFENIRCFIVDCIVKTKLDQSMQTRKAIIDRFRMENPIAPGMIARAKKSLIYPDCRFHNPELLAALSKAVDAFPEPVEVMLEKMLKTCFAVSEAGVVGLE
jgi:hypothetical protein